MGNKGCITVRTLQAVVSSCLFLVWLWATAALLVALPAGPAVRGIAAFSFFCCLPLVFSFYRPFLKAFGVSLVVLLLFLWWWNSLEPTNDKEWAPDVARISHGEIQGDKLILNNVRNFRYLKAQGATDDAWTWEERWETREYDLSAIQGLDLYLSYWASEHIAHAIMSWDFGNGKHLAISIETRKDIHQEYSAVKGFFKQFELSYVAADERDLIRLRTNFRKERVYLYRLLVSPAKARMLLEAYLAEMNTLLKKPEFYDALARNCTTAIFLHTKAINPDDAPPLDWRIVISGHLDNLLYERGLLEQTYPFQEYRQRSRVDLRMQQLGEENYSEHLRSPQ